MTELEKAAMEYEESIFPDFVDTKEGNLAFSSFIAGAQWVRQNRDIEKVLCAACKYFLDDDLITVGFRHDQAIAVADKYFWNWKTYSKFEDYFDYSHFRMTEIQGFLTTKNRFVTREEAAEIAYSAGQISSPKEELYSEDIY